MTGDGDDDDEDRRAILARRNRFVAFALSGLAVGSACGDDAASQPCLRAPAVEMTPVEPPPPEEPPEVDDTAMADAPEDETPMEDVPPARGGMKPDMNQPRPQPVACLNYVSPQVCLSEAPVPELEFKPTDDDEA